MTISKESAWKRLWQAWLRFGHWLGNVMSWVWMPLFYFICAMPFALGVRLFSDPLRLRIGRRQSYWTPKTLPNADMSWSRSQGSVPPPDAKRG
ncbi:MAG: hypothetical protein HY360_19525 [Verrucomicrobia bacterium]|nr:hypothetical protein [Verrucomicrobiota bacterium]